MRVKKPTYKLTKKQLEKLIERKILKKTPVSEKYIPKTFLNMRKQNASAEPAGSDITSFYFPE